MNETKHSPCEIALETLRPVAAEALTAKILALRSAELQSDHTSAAEDLINLLFLEGNCSSIDLEFLDELVRLAAESPSRPISVQKKKSSPQKTESYFLLKFAISLCAILIVALTCLLWQQPKRDDSGFRPIAVVTALADPVFEDDVMKLKVGSGIEKERIALKSGLIELRLSNGVQLVLEGPVECQLDSTMNLLCQRGTVSATVSEKGKGFTVRTPWSNVRDLSTQFVVHVGEQSSEVQVISGKVELAPLVGNIFELSSHRAMSVRQDGRVEQTLFDAKRFVDQKRVEQAAHVYEQKCSDAWSQVERHWNKDPELLLRFDGDASRLEKVGTKSVQGRWKDCNAVAFSRASDVVRMSAPAKRKSFTLFASVHLKDLSQMTNVIFSVSGTSAAGAIHWQINRWGQIQLLLGEPDRTALTNFASEEVVSIRDTGVWLQLATVVDTEAKTVTHYFEGKKVATLPLRSSPLVDFSRSELGNRPRSEVDAYREKSAERFFNGSIDGFLLIGRAVTELEMEQWFP